MTREEFYAQFKQAHDALQRRWTEAAGGPGYVKSDWILLDLALSTFGRFAARAAGIRDGEPLLRLEP